MKTNFSNWLSKTANVATENVFDCETEAAMSDLVETIMTNTLKQTCMKFNTMILYKMYFCDYISWNTYEKQTTTYTCERNILPVLTNGIPTARDRIGTDSALGKGEHNPVENPNVHMYNMDDISGLVGEVLGGAGAKLSESQKIWESCQDLEWDYGIQKLCKYLVVCCYPSRTDILRWDQGVIKNTETLLAIYSSNKCLQEFGYQRC